MNDSIFDKYGIPVRMREGIAHYLDYGIPPGDFLTAVIQNDLTEAIGKADDVNINIIRQYVAFFYNEAPSCSWGSKDAMDGWMEQMRMQREEDEAQAFAEAEAEDRAAAEAEAKAEAEAAEVE